MRRLEVLVCSGTACVSSGSAELKDSLIREIANADLGEEVRILETGCMGPCELGPVMMVYPEGTFYVKVAPKDAKAIVEEHFLKGRPVQRLLWEGAASSTQEVPFFARQHKLVLANCGSIDPESIEEYVARGGYEALAKAINEHTPEEVVDAVAKSGLRGRGGAGFPTGKKWDLMRKAQGSPKYIVCNADEGDPGAFMDRAVLEGDPHAVLEGMAIAAYAVGAERGYIYVRAEYPLAIQRLERSLVEAREMGLLGEGILESEFSFDLELRMGAGAFVCGEETALIASVEGDRGEPRPRPPFPTEAGLWGSPTMINNVETLACVRHILLDGPEKFASVGTAKSKGTKVFALAGQIRNTGLVEVPMGISLRDLVMDIGGGVPQGRKLKAVQIGGPSGGCLPHELLDVSVDYESLREHGAIMGSGGVIVLDDTACMVNVARFFLKFTADESCGKCVPCRAGTYAMLEILNGIASGHGKMEDIPRLKKLAQTVQAGALCGLGQTAPNPVLSTLRFFPEEYEAHVRERACPAGVCPDLIHYAVLEEACRACDRCQQVCPTGAAQGTPGKAPYCIVDSLCIRCGACLEACPFNAISVRPGRI